MLVENFKTVKHIQALGDFNDTSAFELITTAKQTDNRYGDFRYKKADLQEMADNFNNNIVGVDIAVDLNHDREGIALAWIKPKSMNVTKSSRLEGHYSLFAKLYNFTPKGKELVKTGAVKYFSLEIQHKFDKFINNTKKTFKNVIRGLALTNRPVIKDMMPTFSEDNINLTNTSMNAFKIFLAQLKEQEVVTLTEKKTLKDMFAELNEDEQAETKDDKEKVEAKPEEKKEEKEGETDEEKKAREEKEAADKKAEEEKDLSETKVELTETKKKADKALTELRKRDVQDLSEPMFLTDDKKELSFGFAKDQKDNLIKFLMTLSEQQLGEFKTLYAGIKAVDFSEKGLDNEGKIIENTPKADKDGVEFDEKSVELDNEVKAYQEKHDNMSYDDAYEAVISKK